jgi:hypothetical protein
VRATLARRAPELLLSALFVALVLPVILVGGDGDTAGYDDEQIYHLRTVTEDLAPQLPTPDIDEIHIATTPGLHLVTAVFARLVSDDRGAIEAFASLFSLAMVLAVYWLIRRFTGPWTAFLLTLPVLLSHYVLQSAAWLNTDNAALLFIVLTLGVALEITERGTARPRDLALGVLFVLIGAGIRQLALWAAGPFVFAAAVAGGVLERRRPDLRPPALALLASLPAVAMLAYLVARWGQLTPPVVAGQSGTSFAALPFTLAVVGVFGPFFAACAAEREDLRGRAPLLAAAGGALLAFAVPTNHDDSPPHGRRTGGGIWELAERVPDVAQRSFAIAALAAVGGAVLVVLWRAAARNGMQRQAAVVLVAVGCLAVAQAGTIRTYQRYFEPPLLICLALLVTFAPARPSRTRLVVGALCALQLAGCFAVVFRGTLF